MLCSERKSRRAIVMRSIAFQHGEPHQKVTQRWGHLFTEFFQKRGTTLLKSLLREDHVGFSNATKTIIVCSKGRDYEKCICTTDEADSRSPINVEK